MAANYDLDKMRAAAAISTEILAGLCKFVTVGVTAVDVDRYTGELCLQHKVKPAFKGVKGSSRPFPSNLCVSVNEEVLHTIPKQTRVIQEGDLVKLDLGIVYEGHFTDHCITLGVGDLSPKANNLLRISKLAVESALPKVRAGNRVGDLGYTMQSLVELAGFNVLKDYIGHGIGRSLHEPPNIPAYGIPGTGEVLQAGMIICLEAQVVAGTDEVYVADDGWSVITVDGEPAAMFEYMVLVTKTDPDILTDTRAWPVHIEVERK